MPIALSDLRRQLHAITGEGLSTRALLPFGLDALDGRLAGGGLRGDALHEAAPTGPGLAEDAAATLFLAGIAARTAGPILWVVRRRDLFAPGLYQAGIAPERLIHAEARDDPELLELMEEGLRHRGLGAVVGEAAKVPMPATRRLQLAAEGGTAPALLLRRPGRDGGDPLAAPSAAVTRWRIAPAPSLPLPGLAADAGVGRGCWRVALVRQRGGPEFETIVEACDETGCLALPARLGDRAAAPDRDAGRIAA